MTFNHEYPGLLAQSLNELRNSNHLCDVIVNVGGRSFHAHRAVLAACSSYYLAMFTSGFKESSQREINIDGDAVIFEILLEFAYTGILKINLKTAYDILDMACYMQFRSVCKTCCTFIISSYDGNIQSKKMSVGDAFKISILARNHSDSDDEIKQLATASDKYLEINVQDLKRTDEFLQGASVVFLEEFLNREELSSASEEKLVLEIVCNWLIHDWENRHTHAHPLLQKVRLGLVSTENLNKLIDAEIMGIPECKALVDGVLQLKSSNRSMTLLALEHPQMFTTRSTITAPISSFADENIFESLTAGMIKYYDLATHQWISLRRFAPLPFGGSNISMVTASGRLYCAGGLLQYKELDPDMLFRESDSESEFEEYGYEADHYVHMSVVQKDFYQYHTKENLWTKLAPMTKPRHSFRMVYLNGYIYAIAGSNENSVASVMSDMECYSLADKTWHVLSPLPEIFSRISAIVFRGKIFVYGLKFANYGDPILHKMVVYYPDTNTWQITLYEQQDRSLFKSYIDSPVLFAYKDLCYRISYVHDPKADPSSWGFTGRCIPSVNRLNVESNDGIVTVTLGEDIPQEHIPPNRMGAFRIDDDVFVSDKGCVYNTGIKVAQDQTEDVNISLWNSFIVNNYQDSRITCFTFDRIRLEQ